MNVLVIGGAGFIGSNLIGSLLNEGHSVLSLDNYLTGSEANHHGGAVYIYGCAGDVATLQFDADLVFHLGEFSRVEQSDVEPWTCLANTIRTLPSVLQYCHERKAKLIYSGSSTKFSEVKNPYILAKRLNTELVHELCQQYAIPYAITYFYNVYGPGEIASGKYATVVAKFIEAKQHGKEITITGDGHQRRHFTHVDDIVNGLIIVANGGDGDGYGIGADEAVSILELAVAIGVRYRFVDDKPSNRKDSMLMTEKTRHLGWKPTKDLFEYIASCLDEKQESKSLAVAVNG